MMKYLVLSVFALILASCATHETHETESSTKSPSFAIKDSQGNITIADEDIECISYAKSPKGDWQGLYTLKAERADELETMTRNNVGKQISVEICGKLVAHPKVREAITSGRGAFSLSEEGKNCLERQDTVKSCSQ